MITSIQDMMMIVIMMIAEWLPPRRELGVYHRRMNVMMLVMMMMMMSRCLPPRISGCLPPQISVKMMITIVTMMSGCLPPRISGCLPPQRSEMRWSRRSRWCQDVYHSIYLGVYQRRMKNMMMLVMMMMMLSWIHLTRSPFYVITTTCFPRGAAAVLVWRISIGMDPWRIRRHLSDAAQNADCTANTSYIWWIHKDCHFLHSNCSTLCCVSRVVDFVACCMLIHDAYMHAYMHTCIHAKHCVNWLCNPRCLPRLASNWHLTGIGWASPVWRCLIWNRVLLTTLLIDWVSSFWLVYTSRFCIMCFKHVDASRCFCVYGSRHCMCLFGSGSRNGSSRHVTVCIACKMVSSVRNHPKSSLSQQRNRLDAITTGISCDFLRFLSKKVMISAITETKRGEKAGFLWSSLFLKLSETL